MKSLISLVIIFHFMLSAGCKSKTDITDLQVKKNPSSEKNIEKDKDNGNSQNLKENLFVRINSGEAKKHVGDSAVIKGYIADVYISEKVAYLNFGNKFPKNEFSCVIFKSKYSEFDALNIFKNHDVEVTGKITEYKNKPQMILNSKGQIKIIK